jgi:hypothetical protein
MRRYSIPIKMSVRGPRRPKKLLDIVYLLLIYPYLIYLCLLLIVFQMICSTCSR